jgi:hypothetical protein
MDRNAKEEIARLEKKIKALEKKSKKSVLSGDEVNSLAEYRGKLISLKFRDNIIKK